MNYHVFREWWVSEHKEPMTAEDYTDMAMAYDLINQWERVRTKLLERVNLG